MASIIMRRGLMLIQRFAEGSTAPEAPATTGVTGSDAGVQTTQEPQPALRTRRGTPIYEPDAQPAQQTMTATGQTVQADTGSADTYESLVKGKDARFRAEYDADVQAIVQSRLKSAKQQQAKIQGLLDVIGERYNIDVSDVDNLDYDELTAAVVADRKYLEAEAAEQGLSPEQLSTIKKLQYQADQRKAADQASIAEQRQRALFGRIAQEAEALRTEYPGIDIRTEIQDPRFMRLMETGVPVRNAYIALHPELMQYAQQQAAQQAAQTAQQRVAATVQSGMRRPTENGIGAQGASYTDIDVRDPRVRQELKRRALAGEKVVLP